MIGRYHRLDEHEFEKALGIGDRQGSLVWYSPWGHKEIDTTEQLSTHTQEATVYGSQVSISCVAFGE